ncbi:AsmA2 domain-containing protein YhdP [Xenorhabdus bovienii]|uniref:AsmA2 domain-containing protein YhdP n=1 Tax=Xenorhabdus bovienii TaxID=40576 RepID=UPI0023B2C63F|nr:AsmA2 domain-containing protein YhdP [Xenorhabdus bovienii]MDE9429300.1 AsmA2 domain-containing protein YhdP [Xenorhabdus bovienii]
MRRLPGILLATAAIVVIIVALLVSGLRFFLPHINDYRQQVAEKIAAVTDIPIHMGYINGHWESFGPSLEIRDISAKTKDASFQAKKVTLSLNVWRSLLQWRWHFRDLSFYQLDVNYEKPLFSGKDENLLSEPDSLSSFVLEQLNHFDLHDSRLTFQTPSGEKAQLILPQLTWLNKDDRHRAQGSVNLSSINGQEGVVQVKFDLKDINGVLDNGVIYLQADDIDMRLWLSRWLRDNTGLESSRFSLASWITLKGGRIDSGRLQLKQGEANWYVGSEKHQLAVNDLILQMCRQGEGWLFNIPNLANLKTNGQQWPVGRIAALYVMQADKYQGKDHWRLRAENIQLERLNGILPLLSSVTPNVVKDWQHRQPKGMLNHFALDITPELPDSPMGIAIKWQDVSWLRWQDLPSVNHFSGTLSGNKQWGNLKFELKNSTVDYRSLFQAPFDITSSEGQFAWRNDHHGLKVWGRDLDLQAKSLWFNGAFNYLLPKNEPPVLEMLAGIRVDDAGEAWRYFPKPLMGASLTDYLTHSLIKGKIENATLLFQGNPHDFPFKQNNGQFQVWVPLRHATFQYQPDWPALFDFDIDLNFQNNGLWMQVPKAKLGKVDATRLTAVIPDYGKQKLLIDGELSGNGKNIHDYFKHSPLAGSIGSTLDELQLDGRVDGKLHLDIPLEDGKVNASGEVVLQDTALFIKPLDSKMEHVSGKFRFDDGKLQSDKLSAQWLGHPLSLRFTTQDLPKHYQVDVDLNAHWAAGKLPEVPADIRRQLSGTLDWQGKVNIAIPAQSTSSHTKPQQNGVKYRVSINADLSHINSKLAALDTELLREWQGIDVLAEGDMNQIQIKGSLGKQHAFNTQWQLGKTHARLQRGIMNSEGNGTPILPETSLLALNLPEIDGEKWLPLIAPLMSGSSEDDGLLWPEMFEISMPSLKIGGQRWNQLVFNIVQQADGMKVSAVGEKLKGNLLIYRHEPWQASIDYLYYDPQFPEDSSAGSNTLTSDTTETKKYSLRHWPSLNVKCAECWVAGLKLGKVSGTVMPEGDSLVLTNGQLENRAGKLTLSGRWGENDIGNYTQAKGQLSGQRFDEMAAYLGFIVPIVDAPFKFDFDLGWRGTPWNPDIKTLNGTLTGETKKGAIAKLGGGRAGQLLRLISFDALLRKLQLDFSDTFSNDFNFDSIRGDTTIKNGVMYTENFRIDGLAADIDAEGQTDLVRRQINMGLVITPEISTTVGVATAFAVNPVAGAAVFAATKVLGPLWSKISVIRYRLTGSLEQPKIDEVLRQLKENKGS